MNTGEEEKEAHLSPPVFSAKILLVLNQYMLTLNPAGSL